MKKIIYTILSVAVLMGIGGCATLNVTPQHQIITSKRVLPSTVVVKATGERFREAFNDSTESIIKSASGNLFRQVIFLPEEMRNKSAEEIKGAYKADYIISLQLNDINVHGDLNPIWFASIPLFFFKPLTPIVTFDATVTVDYTVYDVKTGVNLLQKEVSVSSTDHFSPINPEEKVRKLISRSINSAVATILEELNGRAND